MTDLFLDILNVSFSATWVVLGVVLARLVLKKAPRSLVCGLWALVALRLLFGGIEAPFSLIPSSEIIPPESLYDQAPVIHSGVSSIDEAVNPVYSESLRPMPGASVNPLQVWLAVFANLWFLGMLAMALWAAISWFRVWRQVRESIPAEDGVYLCDRIGSPFIFGLFRPRIFLPSDMSGESRCHVIAHERAHLARRDHWWKPLGFALLTVNWFNPAMWLAYVLLCRDIEMACDEKVVRNFGVEEKKAYSAALLNCSVNPRRITACPLAFGEVGVKQRIKSVLHYKKPAFWILLVTVVLSMVLAIGFLTDPLSPDPEIRWDNILYIHNGRSVEKLPSNAENVGTLRSILQEQGSQAKFVHPNENGQAAHLSGEYAGKSLYLADGILYIAEPGGKSWLPFSPKHGLEDVLALLDRTVQSKLILQGGDTSIQEFVRDFSSGQDQLHLHELLSAGNLQLRPTLDWDHHMLAVNYADDISIVITPKDYKQHCVLTRRDTDWLILYRDEERAVSAWTFESPELDAAIAPWQNELAFSVELFAEFSADDAPIFLNYETVTMDDIALRMAIPTSGIGFDTTDTDWEWQSQTSYADKTMTIQCRPAGCQDWMEIHYRDCREFLYHYASAEEPIALESGASGTLFHSGDPNRWSEIDLFTTRGQLYIYAPNTALQFTDWQKEDYRMALAMLGTLHITENGTSLFGNTNPLGITLQLDDLTPNGATLVCSQDDTYWDEIITGASWSIQGYRDGAWADLLPEGTLWSAEAILIPIGGSHSFPLNWNQMIGALEPGRYRICKYFAGTAKTSLSPAEQDTVGQTYYVEFMIVDPDTSLRTVAGFSQELHQATQEDWLSYQALSKEEQLASSKMPGSCSREFDDWAEVEQFVGMSIPNPLEGLETLEKGCWAGTPVGYNGASRFYVTWHGTQDGHVQWLQIDSGYRRGDVRVCVNAALYSDPPGGSDLEAASSIGQRRLVYLSQGPNGETVITEDSGQEYEARTGTLARGSVLYSIRVIGQPGTADALLELLNELLPCFEALPTT